MSRYTPQELCSLFTTRELVEHLGVSEATVRRYRNGSQTPPKSATRLLWLIHEGRIMPDNWPESMRFTTDKLSCSMTERPMTWETIQQYEWVIGQWYHSTDFAAKVYKQLRELRAKLPAEMQEPETASECQVLPFDTKRRGPHGWGVRKMRRQQ